MLFPTTVVGSLPRPLALRDLFDDLHHGKIDATEVDRMLDAAVPYAILLQEAAGVDVVSDGEWRRFSYVSAITDVASGFSRGIENGKFWHTVTAKVARTESVSASPLVDDARFAIARATRGVKVALPSPYLLSIRFWDERRSKEAYATREEFANALVPILRDEVIALAKVGVHTVQLDDPHLCLLVDPAVRAGFADPDAEAMHCVRLINGVFAGVTGTVRAVHLCRRNKGRRGWIGEGSYDPILPALRALDVDQLMMEFTIPAAGDTRCLRELPEHVGIGLGCVDCRGAVIDEPEVIAARVEQAMLHVKKERITLAPDCGFAPGNAAEIPIDEAYAKLRNMAKAARLLRERHG